MTARPSGVRTVLGVLLADARRHALQTATTLLGVAVGVAVVVGIHLSSEAAQRSFSQTYGTLAGAATHQVTSTGPMPAARLAELFAAGPVLAAQPVVETTVIIAEPRPGGPRVLRVVGLDPLLSPPFLGAWPGATAGHGGGDGDRDRGRDEAGRLFERVLTEPGLAVLAADDLLALGLTPGARLRVRGPVGTSTLRCEQLPGDWSGGGGLPVALMDIASAQEVLGLVDGVLRFDLVLDEGWRPPDARGAVDVAEWVPLEPGERIERPQRRGERASSLTRAFRANLLALGFLAVLVGSFLVFNMAQFAVTRRRTLLGKLRCLGCSARTLLRAALAEAALTGLAGGVVGLLGGRLLASAMAGPVAGTVSTLYGYIETPAPELDPLTIAGALLLSVAATSLACWAPARSAARTPPILVAGGVLREPLVRGAVPLAFAAAAGLALLPRVGGLVLPALSVLLLLLAVATAFPHLLGAVARTPPRGTVVALALGRLRRSLARTGATGGALVMPLAMTIGIVVMVGSMQREIVAWVEATIGADVYVKPVMQELAPWTAQLDDEVVAALGSWPGVAMVDVLRGVEQRRGDTSFLVAGARLAALERRGSLRVLAGDEEGLLQRVREQDAVLVSEPLYRKTGLGPGAALLLETSRGPRELPIAAVFQDFSFDRGYALMAEETFLALYGEVGVRNAALLLEPGVDADAVAAALSARFPDYEFNTTDAIFARVMDAFDDTFRITYALQGISTALALVGVLTGLLCLHLERRHELGVLRALGATRRRVGGLLLVEALVLVALAAVVALPVGLALAWILVAVVNPRSFGWSFPVSVDWMAVGEVLALAVAAALLAGVVPWLLVRRARIAELVASTAAVLLALGLAAPAAAAQVAPVRDRLAQVLEDDGFVRTSPDRPIVLPRDHGAHPGTRTEWWYVTGALHADDGRTFGFQATWFRRGLVAEPAPRTSALAVRDIMLFHGALTDVARQRIAVTERACRAYAPWADAAPDRLAVHLLGHRLETLDDQASRALLSFGAGEARIELELELGAPAPLRHGEVPGYSVKGHEPGQASWYYSLPRIPVQGVVRGDDGEPVRVTGLAWLDHEFGSSILAADQVGWDWFSVALDDGSDLMLFELRTAAGDVATTSSGTFRAPPDGARDGPRHGAPAADPRDSARAVHLPHDAFEIAVTRHWSSPHTGARYPAGWIVRVPGQALQLEITPLVDDQELRTPGSTDVTYWEGLCRFEGTRGGRRVGGLGYVELVGYTGDPISERFGAAR